MSTPRLIYSEDGYNYVSYGKRVFALPQSLGPVDLSVQADTPLPGVFIGHNLSDVQDQVAWHQIAHNPPMKLVPMLGTPAHVAYYGYNHPAYDSIFRGSYDEVVIQQGPTEAVCESSSLQNLDAALGNFRSTMQSAEVDYDFVEEFVLSRDFLTQLIVANTSGIQFFQGLPLTLGKRPWIVQIEKATTLFLPFVEPGNSWSFDPEARHADIYRILRELLLADECVAIVTNLNATQEALPALFKSEQLRRKVYHLPFAVPILPARDKSGRNFLFTTSWHQHERSFYSRGGVDAVAIFLRLARTHPDIKLTIRAKLPTDLDPAMTGRIHDAPNIHVIEDKISNEAMDQLFAEADFYLLPAASLHTMSTIEAMSHGCICTLADAWGSDEYLLDGLNGLRIPGRQGRYWEFRAASGVLAERYAGLERVDEAFVARATERIEPLLRDAAHRRQLSNAARAYVAEHHAVDKIRSTFIRIMQLVRLQAQEVIGRAR